MHEAANGFVRKVVSDLPDGAVFCKNMALAVASAREGNTRADLWTDGDAFLFWEMANGVMYLSGTGESFKAKFGAFFRHQLGPRMRERGWRDFSLVCKDSDIHGSLPGILEGTRCTEANEILLKGFAQPPKRDDAHGVVPIDAAFLESGAQNSDAVEGEIRKMWPSVERFLENGFGFASVVNGGPVSWCTAEFVSSRSCGVGIETDERFHGRGHGTAVAVAFAREAHRRGLVPHWCAEKDNAASLRVAKNAGFDQVESFSAIHCALVN